MYLTKSIIIEVLICAYYIAKYSGIFNIDVPLSELENDMISNPYKFSKIYIDESARRIYLALNSTYSNCSYYGCGFYESYYFTSKISSLSDYRLKLHDIFGANYSNKSIIYETSYKLQDLIYDAFFWMIVYNISLIVYKKYCKVNVVQSDENTDKSKGSSLDNESSNLFSGLKDTPCYQIIKSDDPILSNMDPIICSDELKSSLNEYISYMNNYSAYTSVGFRPPKGILFVGPPGTGKTMLAKEFAKNCGATFITTCASNFIEKYMGSN